MAPPSEMSVGFFEAENFVDLMLKRARDPEPEPIGARVSWVGEQVEAQVLRMQDAMLEGGGPGWLWPGPGACRTGR